MAFIYCKSLICVSRRLKYQTDVQYKCGYTLVTLPRIVTPYRDSVDGTRDSVTYRKFFFSGGSSSLCVSNNTVCVYSLHNLIY